MSLFSGLLTSAESGFTAAEAGVYGALGMTPAAPVSDNTAALADLASSLTRWLNILKSLDRSMNQRDGAQDLSAQVAAWKSGPLRQAENALLVTPSTGDTGTAQAAHDSAVAAAQALQRAITSRWQSFAASGTPSVSDYALAPVAAVASVGTDAQAAIYKAASAVESAAAPALASTKSLLKYAPYILAGLAALYVTSFLPRSKNS